MTRKQFIAILLAPLFKPFLPGPITLKPRSMGISTYSYYFGNWIYESSYLCSSPRNSFKITGIGL